ncbi:MAG: SAM-dependent DNA methyltransferase [Deltaproteobacteria bacterium]|jgi:hypothetical protein|nr:SAM-dependent DNA methyltransferase [Deltaproteobacteria bacterium]
MPPLNKFHRNLLEAAASKARSLAEDGARAVLGYLGVAEASPPAYLDEGQRDIRDRLKIHGRQLGDRENGDGTQTVDLLVEETAYEHWHRMLFAKFLEANDLLMYVGRGGPVPVTLEECAELAPGEEDPAADGWELAARCASRMLPQVFRGGSPVFDVVFPPEIRQGLEKEIASLPPEIYKAQDSLGWIYQAWQSLKKKYINASEDKIGARELPAVTQVFTDEYLVDFLMDNSLGAWWAARRLSESVLATASDEGELRRGAAPPGVPLDYLRFARDGDGAWKPAAGTFDRWPESLSDFRMIDPSCGSGHFLTAALRMLVPMRMAAEGLSAREAVDAALRDNIHGLELDRRCVEIAVFALAMAAWTYPGAGGYRALPELHVACSGVPVEADEDDWADLAGDDIAARNALVWLHGQFGDAPFLGSLIDPGRDLGNSQLFSSGWQSAFPALAGAVAEGRGELASEIAVFAHGAAKAATVLAGSYHLVATNVPYLSAGKQFPPLREHCRKYYPEARGDIATVFLDRCLRFCPEGGTVAAVTPQNWLSLSSYTKFRVKLLKDDAWQMLVRLGPGAFEAISGEVVKAILIEISRGFRDGQTISCIDVSGQRSASDKSKALVVSEVASVGQARQLDNPDARVSATEIAAGDLIGKYAIASQGLITGDGLRFIRYFWETGFSSSDWKPFQSTVESKVHFGGRSSVIDWRTRGAEFARLQGYLNYGKPGVAVAQMAMLHSTLYSGEMFDSNVGPISPFDKDHLPALWCYCSSQEYHAAVRSIDQKLNVTNATLVKVPFAVDRWTEVAKKQYPYGLPAPYSDDPTQWIFHGHPCGSAIWDGDAKRVAFGPLRTDGTVLHVAVARLLGYRWPSEVDEGMELADEQREWVRRCEGLSEFVDRDGIVAVPAVVGEAAAKDRLLDILVASYGSGWSNDVITRLLASSDHAGGTLESWLRDKFFSQHCRLFQNRPFIWQIWDGLRDGFSALVNYHKLDCKLLESLTFHYIGDWITRQTHDRKNKVEGADRRIAAAENLQQRLRAVIEGEAPYDIFVRWKPLEKQPVGWNPDIDDGVRLNIRPFLMPPDLSRKGAGIMRDRPNVKYDKDRGKDAETAPWYRADGGDRINDRHLKLAEKEKARSGFHRKS